MTNAFDIGFGGKGNTDQFLQETDVQNLFQQAFSSSQFDGKSVLVVIPDLSRSGPVDMMFRSVYMALADRVKALDFIIAAGTHPPLSDEAINKRVGIRAAERSTRYARARFYNHHWNDPAQLKKVGTLSSDRINKLSRGLMQGDVDITINKMVFDYDLLLIMGPTFPHEVVGFSGGNKYLFPGIAGQEIIDMFHWLGALITNAEIIGTKYTPVREVVDYAASMLPIPRLCCSMVVKKNQLAGLYIGTPEEAWSAAADLSQKIHIVYKEKQFKKVLSCGPEMYEDLWTGGKCMYKLEPVVADDGELTIFAPHIKEVSVVHGEIIHKIGYHVRDYFVRQMERFADIPGGVMAHSTHVKGSGTFENGIEKPRVEVVLATSIPEEVCHEINLGYRDPKSIDITEWQDREEEGILFVARAGEQLYRIAK